MEKALKVFKGKEEFPSVEAIRLYDFTYNAKRMGAAPTITCTAKHPLCLDDDWDETVYVTFNGERLYLHKTPTSSYDNTESLYKYDLTFVSERIILDNVYFFDVVLNEDGDYQPVTNSTTIPIAGTIHEFVKRLNYSLRYSKLQVVDDDGVVVDGYEVIVDTLDASKADLYADLYTESRLLTVTDQFFSNVLQECFNTYKIPYWFEGKKIHVGFGSFTTLTERDGSAFQYGIDHSLLSIKKNNTNNKIVNRITGVGSADNIPYYYPNETEKGQISLSFNGALVKEDVASINKHKLSSSTDIDEDVVFGLLTQQVEGTLSVTYQNKDNENVSYGNNLISNHSFSFENGTYKWSYKSNIKVTCETKGILSVTVCVLQILNAYFFHNQCNNLRVYIEKENNGETELRKVEVVENNTIYGITTFNIDFGFATENETFNAVVEWDVTATKSGFYLPETQPKSYYYQNVYFTLDNISGVEDVYGWSGSRKRSEDIADFGITLTDDVLQRISDSPQDFVGTSFKVVQDKYIQPQPNLMPSIYRESDGEERFYNALNGIYEDAAGNAINFNRPYIDGKPSEHIENFDDIKPTIKGMVGENEGDKKGKPFDSFIAFAYDDNDNDETDENGKYIHPYFFAKLPKYNGEYGFNLFDHAIDESEMTISMTSGNCTACEWTIMVNEDQKNTVQVNEKGELIRDEDGNVAFGSPQDVQNDTKYNEVWVALKKDLNTFGTVIPNAQRQYKPAVGDTFVILHIDLPLAYVTAAERRLELALLKYMQENNEEKFSFSMKFSRIYLAENEDVRKSINENSSVKIAYNGKDYDFYISSYTYKASANDALPEISVELAESIAITKNAIENAVSQVQTDFLGKINSIDYLRQGANHFVRKDVNDVVNGKLTFKKGFKSDSNAEFGTFIEGATGAGVWKDSYGNWHIESDFVNVRKKFSATSVEIKESHHIGGEVMLTAASCTIDYVRVVEKEEGVNVYRCYFLKQDADGNAITNDWMVGDQAYCQYYNVTSVDNLTNRFYWRVVKDTSNEKDITPELIEFEDAIINTINYHYIDLAFEGENEVYKDKDKDKDSDAPRAFDKVVQLGYRGDNTDRQNAIIISGAGAGSPSIKQYMGIYNFSLEDKLETQIKPDKNILSGSTTFKTFTSQKETTLGELGDNVDNATTTSEEVKAQMANMVTGKSNLLLNSGFTGDYVTAVLDGDTILNGDSQLFSPDMVHWVYDKDKVTVKEDSQSESGAIVEIQDGGSIKQTLKVDVAVGKDYVISFRGKGGKASITFGGTTNDAPMSDQWGKFIFKINALENANTFLIEAKGTCYLCEIQLERGNTPSAWGRSPLDNKSDLARYEQLTYLENALRRQTTVTEGGVVTTGLINAGLILMGNFNENGTTQKITAGISGKYDEEDDDDDVAFFAGGNLESAIDTVTAYRDYPNKQPTDEEIKTLAKMVITHGGRAILNDIILRGYIYALDGVFNGTVYANGGVFNGTVRSNISFSETYRISGEVATFNLDDHLRSSYILYGVDAYSEFDYQNIYLPSAQEYDGLEISFFLPPTTRAYPHKHILNVKEGSDDFIFYQPNLKRIIYDSETSASALFKIGGEDLARGKSITLSYDGFYKFKSIKGGVGGTSIWIAITGDFLEKTT